VVSLIALPLPGNSSAIKLTTARYYTPNGRSIQAKGIEPDVSVDDGTQRMAMREADLERHLVGDDEKKAADTLKTKLETKPADLPAEKAAAASGKVAGTASLVTKPAESESKPVEYTPVNGADGKPIDFVLQQALNQLKGLPVASNPRALLAAADNAVNKSIPKTIDARK